MLDVRNENELSSCRFLSSGFEIENQIVWRLAAIDQSEFIYIVQSHKNVYVCQFFARGGACLGKSSGSSVRIKEKGSGAQQVTFSSFYPSSQEEKYNQFSKEGDPDHSGINIQGGNQVQGSGEGHTVMRGSLSLWAHLILTPPWKLQRGFMIVLLSTFLPTRPSSTSLIQILESSSLSGQPRLMRSSRLLGKKGR